jgi:hypothetical protein
MLPWFFRYDHTNYARWGAVYLADATQLPAEILQEFRAGNFVVKQSNAKYNQVDPDQSQEWLNATGKKGGGIVGITRTPTALSRWSLSYNLRFHISYLTTNMFHVNPEDLMNHKEATKSRQKLDSKSEDLLFRVLTNFGMFNFTNESEHLLSIATKDKATDVIKESPLNARKIGQKQLEHFVKDRLC